MKPDVVALARQSLLLASVTDHVAKTVLDTAHLRSFARAETVFLQGERASAIYIVVDGWVKLYRIAPSGTEAVVGVFTRGSSFGEAVALRHDTYPVAAEAVTDCKLLRIEADVPLRQIRENPKGAIAIPSATFVHLHGLVAQIDDVAVLCDHVEEDPALAWAR
jgi:CRP-like cAMP-binding protein